jgi:hypothetical protein
MPACLALGCTASLAEGSFADLFRKCAWSGWDNYLFFSSFKIQRFIYITNRQLIIFQILYSLLSFLATSFGLGKCYFSICWTRLRIYASDTPSLTEYKIIFDGFHEVEWRQHYRI